LVYIPNYVDAENLAPEFEPGQYFLYFGRLSVEKGLPTLIRAASAAGVALKIVGTGPQEASLKALASGLPGDITFLGYRSGDELHNLIRAAKAVVVPSEWYENAPLTVLESFALGKPVIGARIGGIPELITERETGWTFSSGSVEELTQVLTETNELSTDKLAAMGRTARNDVKSRFSRSRYRDQVLSVYAQLGVAT